MLKVQNVTKTYPGNGGTGGMFNAVSDVSLSLPDSGVAVIVGESGSGKSTLARMLSYIERPDSGSIFLDETEITGCKPRELRELRSRVQLVMQDAARGILKNIHGTVAQMLKAPERYAVAIETALGAGMQNIIVSTEQDGKAAINMLKRRDGGRATFLPLSTVRGNVLVERGLEQEEGFEGIASTLVEYDERYRGIYNSLLGRTAIVETIDDAIRISRKYSAKFRIVTLDGQVMNAGGSMTGGSASKNAGILSRANELERLRASEKHTKSAIAEAQRADADSAREYEKARQELAAETEKQNSAERERLRLENDVRHYELFISSAQEANESLRAEAGELTRKIDAASEQIAERKQRIEALEEKAREIEKLKSERS
ncbi:MAG: ATP-binding cassette domain-containing protein, partial [Oscillospiraceae bacterium]|nr:ATP-binding cassette domain-containing protein [Oscillospiraceae bacterium]